MTRAQAMHGLLADEGLGTRLAAMADRLQSVRGTERAADLIEALA